MQFKHRRNLLTLTVKMLMLALLMDVFQVACGNDDKCKQYELTSCSLSCRNSLVYARISFGLLHVMCKVYVMDGEGCTASIS